MHVLPVRAMIKSATEAGSIPTFHYMDEVEVDGLLGARTLLKHDDTLAGVTGVHVAVTVLLAGPQLPACCAKQHVD